MIKNDRNIQDYNSIINRIVSYINNELENNNKTIEEIYNDYLEPTNFTNQKEKEVIHLFNIVFTTFFVKQDTYELQMAVRKHLPTFYKK